MSTPAPGQGGLHRLGPEDMYAVRMATATRAPSQGPEDMYAARMATATRALHQSQASGAVTPSAAFHAATPMATAQEHSLSRLAPSVYSHPNVQVGSCRVPLALLLYWPCPPVDPYSLSHSTGPDPAVAQVLLQRPLSPDAQERLQTVE